MFFYRKAFERLGFRVASEFLYAEYKVMLVFKVQDVLYILVILHLQGAYHGHLAP